MLSEINEVLDKNVYLIHNVFGKPWVTLGRKVRSQFSMMLIVRLQQFFCCSFFRSKMIEIDLKEFFSTESYLDELLDKPYFPHLNICEFIMTFMNSGQAIVVLDNIGGR